MMGEPTDKNIIKESQKVAEENLYKNDTVFKHPYSLSIDLYTSTLSSLFEMGDVVICEPALNRPEKSPVYRTDKVRLSTYVSILNGMLQESCARSYFDIAPTLLSCNQNEIQAKL